MVQMFGRMARVPITARQKFNEAAYFYNGMLAHRLNVIIFPYYLSAFLSALRSVTWYLQKQYAHNEDFAAWYSEKQAEMRADPVLKMLAENRTAVVHREPFDLFFNRGFKMPKKYGDYIESTFFEQIEDQTTEGVITTKIRVAKDAPEETVEPWITWHFTEGDQQDVMNHCYVGLERLDAILKELETRRADMGLVADEEIPFTESESENGEPAQDAGAA
jgi:hypothetical protein